MEWLLNTHHIFGLINLMRILTLPPSWEHICTEGTVILMGPKKNMAIPHGSKVQ